MAEVSDFPALAIIFEYWPGSLLGTSSLKKGGIRVMILVGIATFVGTPTLNQASIIAPVGDPTLGPQRIITTAASKPSIILPEPVVADPPVVGLVNGATMAVEVVGGFRIVAVMSIVVSREIYPSKIWIGEDATVPPLASAINWTLEIGRLGSSAGAGGFQRRRALISAGPDEYRIGRAAVVIFAARSKSLIVVNEGRPGVVLTHLGVGWERGGCLSLNLLRGDGKIDGKDDCRDGSGRQSKVHLVLDFKIKL